MEKKLSVLRQCPLFEDIREEELGALLGCLGGRTARYEKEQFILREGEEARYLGIVLSGTAQVTRTDYYGNRSLLTNIGPMEIFGEAFACAGMETMPVDVAATEPTEVLLIDARRITRSCSSACAFHSRMINNLLRLVARKNFIFQQKLELLSRRSTREKLMSYLLRQAKEAGSRSFTIPYDRQELADYLEVERSGLSAEIGKLRREGVLLCRRSEFTLL